MDRIFYTLYTLGKHKFSFGISFNLFLISLISSNISIAYNENKANIKVLLYQHGSKTQKGPLITNHWTFPLFQNNRWKKLASKYLSCKNLCFYHLCFKTTDSLYQELNFVYTGLHSFACRGLSDTISDDPDYAETAKFYT